MKILLVFTTMLLGLSLCAQTAEEKRKIAREHRNNGILKHAAENFKGAIEEFNQAINMDPKDKEFYLLRARSEMRQGIANNSQSEKDEAMVDCNKALQLDPNYTNALYFRATTTNSISAIKDLDQIIRLDPAYDGAYSWRGELKIYNNDFECGCIDLYLAKEYNDKEAQAYIDVLCGKKAANTGSLSILWPLQQNWKVIENVGGELAARTTIIPGAETADNWTEKIVVGRAQEPFSFTLNELMQTRFNTYKSNNTMASLTPIETDEKARYPYIIFTMESMDLSHELKNESQIWLILKGSDTVHSCHVSVHKGMISTESRQKWKALFRQAQIVNK